MFKGIKTYIGIFVAVLPTLSRVLGYPITDVAGLEEELITLLGTVIAVYGRFAAKPV